MHRYRTHTCGALRDGDIGSEVRLSGWCHRIRDHGGVLFIDLRDHYGITQVVADPDSPAFKTAETLRAEWVVRVDGKVRPRPDGTENPDLPTGAVEVYVREIEVLGRAGELPMPVFGDQEYPEEIRLKYRFLDLRREHLHQQHHEARRRSSIRLRRRMKEQRLLRIPDADPDRLLAGGRARLSGAVAPASGQVLRAAAGAAAVQAADHDRRASTATSRSRRAFATRTRAPTVRPASSISSIIEMSFVTQEDVFDAVEPVLRGVFEEFGGGKPVTQKFPRIPYARSDAEIRHRQAGPAQSDRDAGRLRDFRGSGFKIFANILAKRAPRRGLGDPGAGRGGNRAFCDRMNSWAQGEGQPGLGYIFLARRRRSGRRGPLAKNIGPERTKQMRRTARV